MNNPVSVRRDYFWNTAASLMTSLMTVILVFVVTRVMGVADGGAFSLALAIGQQFLTIGLYEVKTYQATDLNFRTSFGTYFFARILTCSLMLLGIVLYVPLHSGDASSAVTTVLIASLSIVFAFEDVLYCEFQRIGQLAVGARASFIRLAITTLIFGAAIWVSHSLFQAALVTCVLTLLISFLVFFVEARRFLSAPAWSSWGAIGRLLWDCLPLCISSFLAVYLVNEPKFVINTTLGNTAQGYFAILFMPALAINLISTAIFRPLLTQMAAEWLGRNYQSFVRVIAKGIKASSVAFVLVFAVTWAIGPQILQLVYGTNVSGYLPELLILVLGGAFNALSVVLYYAITTMRRQRLVLAGYAIATGAVIVSTRALIPELKLLGASVGYTIAMLTLCIAFAIVLITTLRRQNQKTVTANR